MKSEIEVLIRLAKQTDLLEACAIDYEAFSPYGTSELPAIVEARWNVFPQGFVVAEIGDRVVGYGTSEKWLNEREPAMNEDPSKSHNSEGRIFCITAMAVRMEWRKQGVGSAILDKLIQIAKDERCRLILLETTHAQHFYQKRGFHLIGHRDQMNKQLEILALNLEGGNENNLCRSA